MCLGRQKLFNRTEQNGNLPPVQDSGSLAVFKVTARDQSHYKGPWGGHLLHTVTFLVFFLFLFHFYFISSVLMAFVHF